MRKVTFIDTSVLCELVRVPGKSQQPDEIETEFRARHQAGEGFVIPITAVIETGNHIAQAGGDRRAAADRLERILRAALTDDPPFVLNQVAWNDEFLTELCDGNDTGQSFVDLAGNGQMGGGDVAILVERDQFVERSAFSRSDVGIWTLEKTLGAYA